MSTPTRLIFPNLRASAQYTVPLTGLTTPSIRRKRIRPPTPYNFAPIPPSSDDESSGGNDNATEVLPPRFDFEYSGYGELGPRKRKRSSPEEEGPSDLYTVNSLPVHMTPLPLTWKSVRQNIYRSPTPTDNRSSLVQMTKADGVIESGIRLVPRKVCRVNPERLNKFTVTTVNLNSVSPVLSTPSNRVEIRTPAGPFLQRRPQVLPGGSDGLAPPVYQLVSSSKKRPTKRRRLTKREEEEIIDGYAVSSATPIV